MYHYWEDDYDGKTILMPVSCSLSSVKYKDAENSCMPTYG